MFYTAYTLTLCLITYFVGFVRGLYFFPTRKEKYQHYLNSEKWRKFRLQVLKKDDFKCVRCGSEYNLQIHHIDYQRIGKEKIQDCVTLCRNCHEIIHKKNGKQVR